MNELIKILKLNQFELKVKLYEYLKGKSYDPLSGDGFLYAEGDIPVLLVAHMDTVLNKPPRFTFYNKRKDILCGLNGIGGDDRCGVYAIMKLLEEFRPHVLFTEDEELYFRGAQKTVKTLDKPDVKFMIELDRKGNNDCVFYNCHNGEFQEFIENFGFVTDYGTYSDISFLASEWNIAGVNISSGYYNEHTRNEYIKFNELLEIINRIKSILRRNYEEIPVFDYQTAKYIRKYRYNGRFNNSDCDFNK